MYPVDGQEEVALAVRRARVAADWWGGLSLAERRLRLLAWKSHLTQRMGQPAQLVHEETGIAMLNQTASAEYHPLA